MANMEVVFMPQVQRRREQNQMVGDARRKWKQNFLWYPVKQNEFYSEADRIYRETRAKYGDEMFLELAGQKRLNERVLLQTAGEEAMEKAANEALDDKVYKCPN